MRASAIAPRVPAIRNDLSEDKRLLPEQSGHLSRPRRSGQATKFFAWFEQPGHCILIGRCALVQPFLGFPPRPR
jgi:hypothetical protein